MVLIHTLPKLAKNPKDLVTMSSKVNRDYHPDLQRNPQSILKIKCFLGTKTISHKSGEKARDILFYKNISDNQKSS